MMLILQRTIPGTKGRMKNSHICQSLQEIRKKNPNNISQPPNPSPCGLELDQLGTTSTASGLALENESILDQFLADKSLEAYLASTGNTCETRVKLATREVQNQMASKLNSVLQ